MFIVMALGFSRAFEITRYVYVYVGTTVQLFRLAEKDLYFLLVVVIFVQEQT